jgi:hypothetical protein
LKSESQGSSHTSDDEEASLFTAKLIAIAFVTMFVAVFPATFFGRLIAFGSASCRHSS